jgi:hypothetical protein
LTIYPLSSPSCSSKLGTGNKTLFFPSLQLDWWRIHPQRNKKYLQEHDKMEQSYMVLLKLLHTLQYSKSGIQYSLVSFLIPSKINAWNLLFAEFKDVSPCYENSLTWIIVSISKHVPPLLFLFFTSKAAPTSRRLVAVVPILSPFLALKATVLLHNPILYLNISTVTNDTEFKQWWVSLTCQLYKRYCYHSSCKDPLKASK